ncbi:MAG: LysR family transcriptional regulator [Eubacteriales bacterium]|nr:LysR family transcriptional regulator [Eubacteriales bacterium]
MNLNQLKYFQTVYLYGNVSRAADILHISQPSLSESIRTLEDEFGVLLFDRRYRGMKPTEAGDRLFVLSRSLLDDAARIERIMDELGKDRHTIRIGITPMLGSIIIPKIIKRFFMLHPEMRLEVLEPNREDLLKKVDDEMIDIAFIVHKDPLPGTYASIFVSKLEIGCVAHAADSLAEKQTLAVQDLEGHRVVMFTNAHFHAVMLRQYFKEAGVRPDILLQTSQLSTMLEIVRNNLATGFLFKEMMGEFSDLTYIPFEDPIHVNVSMIWNKTAGHFKEMDEFIQFMRQVSPLL